MPQLKPKTQISIFVFSKDQYQYQLTMFSDASSKGYNSTIFLRIATPTYIKVSLLFAKTKLAPVKTLSIPRPELCGALLLSKLYFTISNYLNTIPQNIASKKVPSIIFLLHFYIYVV